jgi:nucleotide-binding universal stress UspA family protein
MYSKILLPLDGSNLAEQVVPYASALARGLGIGVTLLQAIDPDGISVLVDPAHGRYFDAVAAGMRAKALEYLKTVAAKLDGASIACEADVGKAADVVIERGRRDPGMLIAMATRGRSGIQRWAMGSVADKVLHSAANHVLLFRPEDKTGAEPKPLRCVIVPLDGSPLAEKILPHVAELAKKMRLDVILLQAYMLPLSACPAEGYVTDFRRLSESFRKEAEDYLQAKAATLRSLGIEEVATVAAEGPAAEKIIEHARGTPDNLIAMCTHGRTGVSRWLLGSVTERVVRHSGDPVLVVRAA